MDFDTASQLPLWLGLRLSVESEEAQVKICSQREPQVDPFVQESFSRRDAMEAKLHQIREENRRLTEMVTNLLLNNRGSFDFSSNTDPRENEQTILRKGKTINFCKEPSSETFDELRGQVESNPSDENPCKRLRVDMMAKSSQICVRSNPTDASMVQRSAEDRSILVATYEGQHNHPLPSRDDELCSSPTAQPSPIGCRSSAQTIDLDASQQGVQADKIDLVLREIAELPNLQGLLAEQIAASLAKDPEFTAAIAVAISEKMFNSHQLKQQ